MGILKINNQEFKFEDRDTGMDIQVTCGNVLVNGVLFHHSDHLEELKVEAFDLKGHHFTFSNVGMGSLAPHKPTAIAKAKRATQETVPLAAHLGANLVDDLGREGRNLQRRMLRGGLNALVGSFFNPKEKKGKK